MRSMVMTVDDCGAQKLMRMSLSFNSARSTMTDGRCVVNGAGSVVDSAGGGAMWLVVSADRGQARAGRWCTGWWHLIEWTMAGRLELGFVEVVITDLLCGAHGDVVGLRFEEGVDWAALVPC
ncbi:uncharacterized protein A4U43_C09F14330 [Asparagus officinalis]|uniref:Uncharacterized protein n=1 Tax=Asparagus officinalis TaxID=4686 RepID=A0A5P1E7L5_ASPOF|nr:uncharacterized protein A4U43_C09F14330 [Asparagus officinalis]